ncbi:MAG: zf-TFIIB domain-containing protein [Desulfobulbaceae bacterium]|nr:zf-TFIIB domain-containing protein [Desulfobulbaceae bacterium]
MNCPKCDAVMEAVEYNSVEVDRCTNCQGIWFDMLEAEQLKDIKGAESIDIGDQKVGKEYNKIDKVNCPKCKTLMSKMVDNDQPHIWYEACGVCYGVFFDAGEFRDYKEENIFDFFKKIIKKPRQ